MTLARGSQLLSRAVASSLGDVEPRRATCSKVALLAGRQSGHRVQLPLADRRADLRADLAVAPLRPAGRGASDRFDRAPDGLTANLARAAGDRRPRPRRSCSTSTTIWVLYRIAWLVGADRRSTTPPPRPRSCRSSCRARCCPARNGRSVRRRIRPPTSSSVPRSGFSSLAERRTAFATPAALWLVAGRRADAGPRRLPGRTRRAAATKSHADVAEGLRFLWQEPVAAHVRGDDGGLDWPPVPPLAMFVVFADRDPGYGDGPVQTGFGSAADDHDAGRPGRAPFVAEQIERRLGRVRSLRRWRSCPAARC